MAYKSRQIARISLLRNDSGTQRNVEFQKLQLVWFHCSCNRCYSLAWPLFSRIVFSIEWINYKAYDKLHNYFRHLEIRGSFIVFIQRTIYGIYAGGCRYLNQSNTIQIAILNYLCDSCLFFVRLRSFYSLDARLMFDSQETFHLNQFVHCNILFLCVCLINFKWTSNYKLQIVLY